MSIAVQFFVPGIPRPGGSKRAFYRAGMKHAVIVDAGGEHTKNWRSVVSLAAKQAFGNQPLECPLSIVAEFIMPRPKSHYRTGRNAGQLRPDAPHFHTSKPDASKVWRSTEDACTGILWRDDSRIALQTVSKVYGDAPGVRITVTRLEAEHGGSE